MADDKDFESFGFAGNPEININEPKAKGNRRGKPDSDDIMDAFKNIFGSLSPDQQDELREEAENISDEEAADMMDQINNAFKGMGFGFKMFDSKDFSGIMDALKNMFQFEDDGSELYYPKDEKEEEPGTYYALDSKEFLDPSFFGEVKCIQDPELYNKFIAKYGTDSTKYLDDNTGLKQFNISDLTEQLPFQAIKNLKLISFNDEFILFYAEPKEPTQYGFFISVIEDENGEFCVLVPEYYNTFKVDGDENVSLFDINDDSEMFATNKNGMISFMYLSIPAIEFSTRFMLAPIKNTLLTPHQFGTIKNSICPVHGYTSFLKVGTITSNESPEAILLKKDAGVPLEQMSFPFFIRLPETISESTALEFAETLFKVDFNSSPLFDNLELHCTHNGEFYVDLDLGEIF